MDDSMPNASVDHYEYSYRLPTPPRIVIPPPSASGGITYVSLRTEGGLLDEDGVDTSFLLQYNLAEKLEQNTLLEWSYENRRKAQVILPWLYLGPMTAARDQQFLIQQGITMVLAIRSRQNSMTGALQAARDANVEVQTLEAPEVFHLTPQFRQTTRAINLHLAKIWHQAASLGKILVFCESGNERSAAVVAAYLMEMLDKFDHIAAIQMCQGQRFCVNFDDAIKNILKSYWDVIIARRSVAESNQQYHQRNQPTMQANGVHAFPVTALQPSVNGHFAQPQTVQPPPQQKELPGFQPSPLTKNKRSLNQYNEDEDVEMGHDVRANTPFLDAA